MRSCLTALRRGLSHDLRTTWWEHLTPALSIICRSYMEFFISFCAVELTACVAPAAAAAVVLVAGSICVFYHLTPLG
jgi:hypothetical protein